MNKFRKFNLEDSYNPFEFHDNSKILKESLDEIDNKSIRLKYKNTEDPINLVFESIQQTSLKTLTKDFIQESFSDFIIFVSKLF